MNAPQRAGILAALGLSFGFAGVGPAQSQTHFIQTIAPAPAPVFQALGPFDSPVGTGANRVTFLKLVTNAPAPQFQIQRAPGVTAQVEPDAPADPDDNIVEGAALTPVAGVQAVTAGSGAPFCPVASAATGYTVVCIIVTYDDAYDFTAGPETWQLNVLEDTSSSFEYFGWTGVVEVDPFPYANAEAAVTREKIEVSASIQYGGVHKDIGFQFGPEKAPDVRNIGTAALTINTTPISNNAHGFFSGDPGKFSPGTQLPGESMVNDAAAPAGIWIVAHPTANSSETANLTLQSANDTVEVTLEATGFTLFSHFLLDCSASMGWEPDGSETNVEEDTRLWHVKQAVVKINNWIDAFSASQAYTGLGTFGECVGVSQVGKLWEPISDHNHGDVHTETNNLTAGGWTPMESGIEVVTADMDARIADTNLEPMASDRPDLSQTILLLSDGYETDGNAVSEIPGLNADGVRIYSIGYGIPGSKSFDEDLLASLAAGTSGEFFSANSLSFTGASDALKNAVGSWIGLQSVVDPIDTIRAGQTASHTACLDPAAFGATFVVEWNRPIQNGITFTVGSPSGEVITPVTPGVSFFSEPSFSQYILQGDRVRAGVGAGPWTMSLSGSSSLPSNEDTEYAWSVLAQTPMDVKPVRKWGILTGGEYLIEVEFQGWPPEWLQEAQVQVDYDTPAESFGTYLAASQVQPDWVFPPRQLGGRLESAPNQAGIFPPRPQTPAQARRAPDSIMGEPATIAQRKAWALANIGGTPFSNERSTGTLQMYDDGTNGDRVAGDGVYSARMNQLQYEGIYNYAIAVSTPASSEVCVNRDIRLTDLVAVHLTSDLIVDHLQWESVTPGLFFDPSVGREFVDREMEPGMVRTAAVFTPMDELGNHWGPGRADDVEFTVTGGTAVGSVTDNWDGSYIQVIDHQRGTEPTVIVNAAGVTSVPISKPSGPPLLLWVLLILIAIVLLIVAIRRL